MAIDSDQTIKAPTVLLLGASSQIGVFVIPQLILAGFEVFAVSRKGRPDGYPDFAQVEWLSEAEAMNVVHSCEYLLSAGPLDLAKTFLTPNPEPNTPNPEIVTPNPEIVTPGSTRGPSSDQQWQESKMDSGSPRVGAFRQGPERQTASPATSGLELVTPNIAPVTPNSAPVTPNIAPVTPNSAPVTPNIAPVTPGLTRGPSKTAIIFSSSSVESKQASNNPGERSQIKSMLDLESELQLLAKSNSTKLVIFRPTLIYGCGLDTNISLLANWINKYGFIPVNGKAAGMRQPVHAEDLASVAINALLSEKDLADVMFLGGGETLSYSEMVERIFIAMGKPVRLVRLPQWVFVLLVRIAGWFNIAKGVNGEMVKRQRVDLVFDDHLAREMLDYRPRRFLPTEVDFLLPDFED